MNRNVVYVGIDVDDVQLHGSALDRQTGELLGFQCRPTLKGLVGQLEKVRKHFGGAPPVIFPIRPVDATIAARRTADAME